MRFRFILITLCTQVWVYAQDSLTVKLQEHLSPATSFTGYIKQNPAAILYAPDPDITEMGVNVSRDSGKAAILQNGTRKDELNFNVKTLQRLSNNRVWGNVLYRNGYKDDVRWNESADYHTIYPYVMNDTVGGDNLKFEEYSFSGGYVQHLDKWNLGLQLDYRALKEYRTVDPRPDNVSDDLYFKLGTTYRLTRFFLGADVYYRKYKQSNTVKFYSQIGSPMLYHDTGLGNNIYLFAGNHTEGTYDGNGYGVHLQLIPTQTGGFTSSLGYENFSFEKRLLQSLPISYIDENKFNIDIAYTGGAGIYRGAKLSASYKDRRGTENRFRSPQSGIYEKISSAEMYSHQFTSAKLSLIYGNKNKKNLSWFISPWVAWTSSTEKYKSPQREMRYSNVTEAVSGQLSINLNKILLTTEAGISFTQSLDSAFLYNELSEESYAYSILNRNYTYLSSANTAAHLSLRGDYAISAGIGLFLKAYGSYGAYKNDLDNYRIDFSAGIVF